MGNTPKKETTVKVKDLVVPGKQVQTIVDFTGPQPFIKLECPECHIGPERIGAKFCSNCGTPLIWENIWIRKPEDPKPKGPEVAAKEEAAPKPTPKDQVN